MFIVVKLDPALHSDGKTKQISWSVDPKQPFALEKQLKRLKRWLRADYLQGAGLGALDLHEALPNGGCGRKIDASQETPSSLKLKEGSAIWVRKRPESKPQQPPPPTTIEQRPRSPQPAAPPVRQRSPQPEDRPVPQQRSPQPSPQPPPQQPPQPPPTGRPLPPPSFSDTLLQMPPLPKPPLTFAPLQLPPLPPLTPPPKLPLPPSIPSVPPTQPNTAQAKKLLQKIEKLHNKVKALKKEKQRPVPDAPQKPQAESAPEQQRALQAEIAKLRVEVANCTLQLSERERQQRGEPGGRTSMQSVPSEGGILLPQDDNTPCPVHEVSVSPKRTSCSADNTGCPVHGAVWDEPSSSESAESVDLDEEPPTRCTVRRRIGNWIEIWDAAYGTVYYANEVDKVSTWDPRGTPFDPLKPPSNAQPRGQDTASVSPARRWGPGVLNTLSPASPSSSSSSSPSPSRPSPAPLREILAAPLQQLRSGGQLREVYHAPLCNPRASPTAVLREIISAPLAQPRPSPSPLREVEVPLVAQSPERHKDSAPSPLLEGRARTPLIVPRGASPPGEATPPLQPAPPLDSHLHDPLVTKRSPSPAPSPSPFPSPSASPSPSPAPSPSTPDIPSASGASLHGQELTPITRPAPRRVVLEERQATPLVRYAEAPSLHSQLRTPTLHPVPQCTDQATTPLTGYAPSLHSQQLTPVMQPAPRKVVLEGSSPTPLMQHATKPPQSHHTELEGQSRSPLAQPHSPPPPSRPLPTLPPKPTFSSPYPSSYLSPPPPNFPLSAPPPPPPPPCPPPSGPPPDITALLRRPGIPEGVVRAFEGLTFHDPWYHHLVLHSLRTYGETKREARKDPPLQWTFPEPQPVEDKKRPGSGSEEVTEAAMELMRGMGLNPTKLLSPSGSRSHTSGTPASGTAPPTLPRPAPAPTASPSPDTLPPPPLPAQHNPHLEELQRRWKRQKETLQGRGLVHGTASPRLSPRKERHPPVADPPSRAPRSSLLSSRPTLSSVLRRTSPPRKQPPNLRQQPKHTDPVAGSTVIPSWGSPFYTSGITPALMGCLDAARASPHLSRSALSSTSSSSLPKAPSSATSSPPSRYPTSRTPSTHSRSSSDL